MADPTALEVDLDQVTGADPRNLTKAELAFDIAYARSRAKHHIERCGRHDDAGPVACREGRDKVAEQDELLEVWWQRG